MTNANPQQTIVRDLAYKAIQFKERFNKEKGREPTIEEIAKELGLKLPKASAKGKGKKKK